MSLSGVWLAGALNQSNVHRNGPGHFEVVPRQVHPIDCAINGLNRSLSPNIYIARGDRLANSHPDVAFAV